MPLTELITMVVEPAMVLTINQAAPIMAVVTMVAEPATVAAIITTNQAVPATVVAAEPLLVTTTVAPDNPAAEEQLTAAVAGEVALPETNILAHRQFLSGNCLFFSPTKSQMRRLLRQLYQPLIFEPRSLIQHMDLFIPRIRFYNQSLHPRITE